MSLCDSEEVCLTLSPFSGQAYLYSEQSVGEFVQFAAVCHILTTILFGCIISWSLCPHVHLYVSVCFFAWKCEAQIYFLAASLSDRKRGR